MDAVAERACLALVEAEMEVQSNLYRAPHRPPDDAMKARQQRMRVLVLELLRYVDGGAANSAVALTAAQRALEGLPARGTPRMIARIATPSVRHSRGAARDAVTDLVHEVGLTAFDAVVHLDMPAKGKTVFHWEGVSPEAAHVWLLDHLYQIFDAAAAGSLLLQLERDASNWYFSRFSVDPGRDMQRAYAQMHRAWEWRLVDRPTIAMGISIAEAASALPDFRALPARMVRLANALRESRVGVFSVTSRSGTEVRLRDSRTEETVRVVEHSDTMAYRAGAIALGRIIPFERDVFLRTPGMLFFEPLDATHGDALAATVRLLGGEGLDSALALEAVITSGVLGQQSGRAIPPAKSNADAMETLYELFTELDKAGLAERVPASRQSRGMRKLGAVPGRRVVGTALDPAVAEWVRALSQQAGIQNAAKSSGRSRSRRARQRKRPR